MRILILVILALLAAPASAQDWSSYGNGRFGYEIDIPPLFVGQGESDNGDGQVFARQQGAARLTVWGANMMAPNFEGEVAQAIEFAKGDGWTVSYQAATPEWASFSGTNFGRIMYQRMVLLCDRHSWAAFQLDYSLRDGKMDPIIEQLVRSLRGDC
jgi:hypothetical protein